MFAVNHNYSEFTFSAHLCGCFPMYGQYMYVDIGYRTCVSRGGGGGEQVVCAMITLHGRWIKGGCIFIHYS